jgi:hypothetical protein
MHAQAKSLFGADGIAEQEWRGRRIERAGAV